MLLKIMNYPLHGRVAFSHQTFLLYNIYYINENETKISLHRVSCEDHNHQGLT